MEAICRHIPAKLIEEYQGYCPLIPIYGVFQEDGTFLSNEDHGERRFTEDQLITEPGFLILEIGSVENEFTLNEAAKAIHQSLESLFLPCGGPVSYERIRTTIELEAYLTAYRENFSHIIMIGHGNAEGINFLDKPNPVAGHSLTGLLGADRSQREVQLITLCCHSGCKNIAKALSSAVGITHVIAPKSTFDIRWSVHFISGYFLNLFLSGNTIEKSVCNAISDKQSTPMTIWQNGTLIFDCDN